MSSVTLSTGERSENEREGRPVSSRLAGLARAVEGARRASFDVRQTMLAAGATCMGLGIVAIVLGWYGAAHSAYLFQEIPYLISGGLLGVALVAGGGFLFFASWFVRMIEDNHRYASRVERTLERVDHILGAIADEASAGGERGTQDRARGQGEEGQESPIGSYRERDDASRREDATTWHPGEGSRP